SGRDAGGASSTAASGIPSASSRSTTCRSRGPAPIAAERTFWRRRPRRKARSSSAATRPATTVGPPRARSYNAGMTRVTVVGGGLAGCEAAWQLSRRGIGVDLYEMRPVVQTPVHQTGDLAELVCSNSLRGNALDQAAGLLKEEMRRPAAWSSALPRRLFEQTSSARSPVW